MKYTTIDGIKIEVEHCYYCYESFDGICPFKHDRCCSHPGCRDEYKYINNIDEMPMKFCPLPEKEDK